MPIEIPDNDLIYSLHGQRCMNFQRSLAGHRPNCALGKLLLVKFLKQKKAKTFAIFWQDRERTSTL